ncbi:MAG: sugar 3,4-ketoisomerase [Solirubrobacteraceae bacterium]
MTETRAGISIADCRVIDLPVCSDLRGNLTAVEGARHVPFEIARIFYLDGVPPGATRAGHANRRSDQVLIALAGSFEVSVDDGCERHATTLSASSTGYLVPRMIWHELARFSPDAICLVLASRSYDETDYHRDYDEYLRAIAPR